MSQSDFVTRGQALVASGQYQEAVKVCRLGLLGRPTTVEGRIVLGQALLALKRYDEVIAEMHVAIDLDPTSPVAQALRGEALLRKGDAVAALDVLGQLRSEGRADARVAELIAEAERLVGTSSSPAAAAAAAAAAAGRPAADDSGAFSDQGTRNYPGPPLAKPSVAKPSVAKPSVTEDSVSEYTRPTSIADRAPGRRRTSAAPPMATPPEATPSPAGRAIDRSGTVEVDPDLETVDVHAHDDDFGDIAAPPIARDPGGLDGARGSVPMPRSRRPSAQVAPSRRQPMIQDEVSTVELGDDEVYELEEPSAATELPNRPGRRPAAAMRNAIKLPSGPLGEGSEAMAGNAARGLGEGSEATGGRGPRGIAMPAGRSSGMPAQPGPGSFGQGFGPPPAMPSGVMSSPPTGSPQPVPLNPRSAIAAALPTAAALPLPQPMPVGAMAMAPAMMPGAMAPTLVPGALMAGGGMPPGSPIPPYLQRTVMAPEPVSSVSQVPAMGGSRSPIGLNAEQQQSAAVVDALFAADGQGASWARPGSAYGGSRMGGDEPARPAYDPPYDPQIAARSAGQPSGGVSAVGTGERGSSLSNPARPVRKARSRLQVLVWILIGAAVISGGVFAGFQIRALRLRRQIVAARDRAGDLARADTWQGWLGARDGLFSIAQASPTPDNRAALARARGVLAFEFGDNLPAARAALDTLAGQSGLDVELAGAYLALTARDSKTAHDLAERAVQEAPGDAAALYVQGQAALLAGDPKAAIAALRGAVEHEPRPLYVVGLARALGEATVWDDALATADKVRDNPGAVIARAVLLAGAGRVTGAPGSEVRAQLGKVIADGQKPGDQSVSPSQVAFAYLALARIDFARGEAGAAHADYVASLGVGLDDQRYAEEIADTVLAIGEVDPARKIAARALERWPVSRRARTTLAETWLAAGKPALALEVFSKAPDVVSSPRGQTVRGLARLASGDPEGARGDFDAVLKRLPGFEPAVVARTWIDLAAGDLEAARRRIEPKFNVRTATPAMVTTYAAILRSTGESAARDKAKAMLERVAAIPGPDAPRAQLELARVDRELGDFSGARAAYAEAGRAGSLDARLEIGGLLIEIGDPRGGHDALEQLLKDASDRPSPALLIEAARSRTLIGDHRGAFALLAAADASPGVVRWQLDRERGRLALRKGDVAGAAQALGRALDGCGGDLDSFLLAADTVSYDDKQTVLAQKLRTLTPSRLKGKPELDIITGKLALAANQFDEAYRVYTTAHQALERIKASPRRLAQCDFGLGATAYFRRDDATAASTLKLVVYEDPSIDEAYLFAAELQRARDPVRALATAQLAVAFNPASVEGWKLVGAIAAQARQRKLLDEAITRVGDLAPGSDALRQLQRLR